MYSHYICLKLRLFSARFKTDSYQSLLSALLCALLRSSEIHKCFWAGNIDMEFCLSVKWLG